MKTVVLVIMVLICFNFCLKQTFLRFWQLCVSTLACALFVGLIWPYAIEQSRQQIEVWLADQPLMLDTSVLLTLEALWQMAFCLLAGKLLYEGQLKTCVIVCYRILRFFPGLLILAVLFAAEVALIYQLPGVDFAVTAWGMSLAVLILLPALYWLIRWLLPERDLRLEILFLCNALLLLLGIVATVNGTTSFKGSDAIEWTALAAFLLLTLVCSLIGWMRYRKTINSIR